jgi:transposase-like protein
LEFFHPHGLRCPHCGESTELAAHRHHRARIVVDYLCQRCGQFFNVWTGTPLQRTHYRPSEIMRLIAGIHEGISTAQLARDLRRDRSALSKWRRRLERWVTETFGRPPHGKRRVQGGLRNEGSRPMSRTTVSLQFEKKSPKRRKRS